MASQILDTPIEFLKGVGPARADVLRKELGIFTFKELLYHLPFRYVDRSKFYTVSELNSDAAVVQLKGRIVRVSEVGVAKAKRLTAIFEDGTGQIELVWFKGAKWIKDSLRANTEYVVYGKISQFKSTWNIVHPEIETVDKFRLSGSSGLRPVYNTTEKLTSRGLHSTGISKLMEVLLPTLKAQIPETLSTELVSKLKFYSREEALMHIHFPPSLEEAEKARNRLKFDELFFIQLMLIKKKLQQTRNVPAARFAKVGELFNQFYDKHLAFDLTEAQKRVIKEIRSDVNTGYHMNRLLQGDVGSGKTIVALLCALLAIDNGYQVAVMAPTEILAKQHFESFSASLEFLPVTVSLLTGSTKTAARREIHASLMDGSLNILIGTHALIEPKVEFKQLGLAIVDEQHRFGVAQRARLWNKAKMPPHILVMTATPIPRTLAMTLYGDLDLSVIDELPPGRKPILTVHRTDSARLKVFKFIKEEIALGRQIYIVYPLIEESQALDYKDLMDGYESISRSFPLPDYKISIVHGKMKSEDKNHEMQRFISGETQILVATTVIEVGVNVPNASVMIIESAERFGLSQLHQLRGRVGRGADQSYCILMTDEKISKEAKIRVETMCRTNDGFELSEVDLELRGPGDLMGTQQSGELNLAIADLVLDKQILITARHLAMELLERDPSLTAPENSAIRLSLADMMQIRKDWSQIS
ncbi:MAG: ATP-dependent DNA helicase RecG [Cryomorphaceae bacterium]|nr:ATP-dependent DNA helicase RecG [Cryomorphaceae bacterium]